MPQPVIALTGASGFIGRHLVNVFADAGWKVRAMVRRPDLFDIEHSMVDVVKGDLDDRAAIHELLAPATHIVHAAGIVSARNPDEFDRINVDGTRAIVDATQALDPQPYFLHLSSLAAREPEISRYAQSKSLGERLIFEQCTTNRSVIRPPAVYGPGDRATLPIFAQLASGFLICPKVPRGRFSMIHVADLARLVQQLCADQRDVDQPIEPDDGQVDGYSWQELGERAGHALASDIRLFALPAWTYRLIAMVASTISFFNGKQPLLSQDKVEELFHTDWVSRRHPDHPRTSDPIRMIEGFQETMSWYRHQGWIRSARR